MATKEETHRLHASRYARRTANCASKGATRFSRYSRYSRARGAMSSPKTEDYQIRKSLADCVREELDVQSMALFYQRVCIVAKNRLSLHTSHSEITKGNATPAENAPQNLRIAHSDGLLMQLLDIDNASVLADMTPERRFHEFLAEKITAIHLHCYKETLTTDQLYGMNLCMGEYTLLILEGADDMVGEFCIKLAEVADKLWTNNRVFFVEDRINDMYFKSLLLRFSSPINLDETFPTTMADDEYLMGREHWTIMQRVKMLCTTVAADENVDEDSKELVPLDAEHYNKLLPDVQRLDLVLNSTRFYRNVQDFAKIYWVIPEYEDDDALTWPVPFGYALPGVFDRSPFDVNLTFAHYGNDVTENEEVERGSGYHEVSGEPHKASIKGG